MTIKAHLLTKKLPGDATPMSLELIRKISNLKLFAENQRYDHILLFEIGVHGKDVVPEKRISNFKRPPKSQV